MKYILIILPFLISGCHQIEEPSDAVATEAVAAMDSIAVAPVTEGHQVKYTQDGGRIEGELHEGKRVGPWASYFADGKIRSRITYVDGLEEGPTEVFHETGKTYYAGQYHKGVGVGEWIFYNAQGEEEKRVSYDSTGVMLK